MTLFDQILDRFHAEPEIAATSPDDPADVELKAATAVLLLEAAYGDSEYAWSEHRVIVRGLERAFGLGHGEVMELLGQAEEIRPPVVSLADVIEVLRSRLDPERRQRVVELLWRVIGADGVDEAWEESFAEHVATSLELSPEQQQESRRRAGL